MASELTSMVLRAALFTSCAIVLLLAVRTLLRRWLGATLAYQAWLIVPLVAIAATLPVRPAPLLLVAPALEPVQAFAAQAAPFTSSRPDVLLLVWVAGMLSTAAWFVHGHRAFLRRAGRLAQEGGVHTSAADIGPASVGLFAPRIIVPHDFGQRYSPVEQALILTHERIHVARRDAVINLVAAVFQCAFWFNPLVRIGVRCLRQDQELACDAATMRRHPHQRRAYAEALLKCHTRAGVTHAGIHCHWQSHHPTKERLMNLQHTLPGPARRVAGRCLVALLALGAIGATLGARAEQAASAPSYSVAMVLDAGGAQSTPRIVTRSGETFAVASGEWRVEMVVRPAPASGEVWLAGKILRNGEVLGTPTLRARHGEQAGLEVGAGDTPFSLSMTVSPHH